MADFLLDDFMTDLKLGTKSFPSTYQLKKVGSLVGMHHNALKAEKEIEDLETDSFIQLNTNVSRIDEEDRDLVRHVHRLKEELDGVLKSICKRNVADCVSDTLSAGREEGDKLSGIFPRFCLPVRFGAGGIHEKRKRDVENNGSVEIDNGKRRRVNDAGETEKKAPQDDEDPDYVFNDTTSGDLEEEIERLKKVFAQQIVDIYSHDPFAVENICSKDEWDIHHWGRALNLLKDDKKVAFAEFLMKEMKCESAVQEQMLDLVMRKAPGFFTEYFMEYERILQYLEGYMRQLIQYRRHKVFLLRSEAELEKEESEEQEENDGDQDGNEPYEPGLALVSMSPLGPPVPPVDHPVYSPTSPESPPPATPPPMPE